MKNYLNSLRGKLIYTIPLICWLLTFLQGCYPIGDGGVVFYVCQDCYSPYDLYIYVDGNFANIVLSANYYNITCDPSCQIAGVPTITSASGAISIKEGEHVYTVKNSTGTVVSSGSFNINKQKCTMIQLHMQGGLGGGC